MMHRLRFVRYAGVRVTAALPLLLLLCSCRLEPSVPASDGRTDEYLGETGACIVITTAEYGASGAVALLDPDTLQVFTDVTATHHDATVSRVGSQVVVVNREGFGGNTLQLLQPGQWQTLAQVAMQGATPNPNPWQVVGDESGRAWVSLYNEGELQQVTLGASSIALTALRTPIDPGTETDGRVEPGEMFIHDGHLYVLAQGMSQYPRCQMDDRSRLLRYALPADPTVPLGEPEQLTLAACNPVHVERYNDTLWVAHAGNFRSLVGQTGVPDADNDGGLEQIDLRTFQSDGLVLRESDTGGRDLLFIGRSDSGRFWTLLSNADFTVSVHELIPSEALWTLQDAVWTADGEGISDIVLHNRHLWLADRSRQRRGVVVIDEATGEALLAGQALDTGLPPFDLQLLAGLPGCWLDP
jgi:hypothetical protein